MSLAKYEPILWVLLGAALFMRLVFPHYFSPLDHLFSDPLRHWDNAMHFHENRFFAGMDPKAYQWFLAPIYHWWHGDREPTEWAVGVQCCLAGVFWFLTARELLPKCAALVTGIILATVPSLLVIYGYFMSETMLLMTLGLAWWLSLLTWRKRSVTLFILTVAAWWLAILSRVIALPLGLGMMALLWWILPRKNISLIIALIVTANMLHPAAEYTKERIGIYTPFSYGMLNKIYVRSHHRVIGITLSNGVGWGFESPSFYTKPLEPFSDYQMMKKEGPHNFTIDISKGEEDWYKAYEAVSENYHFSDYLTDVRDNLLYTLFARSWPDSTIDPGQPWVLDAGTHHRWIWAPLIVIAIMGAFFAKLPPRQAVFLLATVGLFGIIVIQNSAIMEGRYRKPLEPMLIISAAILCTHRRRDEGRTLWEYARGLVPGAKNKVFVDAVVHEKHHEHGDHLRGDHGHDPRQ